MRYFIVSIIYKALQKTQKNREKDTRFSPEETAVIKTYWVDKALIATILALLTIVLYAYYPKLKNLHLFAHSVKYAAQPAVNEVEFKNKFVLTGIFISDQTKIAMINNQYVHLGDIIGNMRVVYIGDNLVKLQNQNQLITLEAPI
jgi:hypothetical protein